MQTALLIDIHKPYQTPQVIPPAKWEFTEDMPQGPPEVTPHGNVFWVPQFSAQVSCGLFGIADDHIEKYQSLDSRFIKNKASTFFFTAASNSMEPLIMEGDVLIVDRSVEVISGRVAVICLDGEMLCKRIVYRGGHVLLRSENPDYTDLLITEGMDLVVFGVVTSIAREII
ncbi:MAG: S24 family peptidase [Bdellovibrionaceae bacterium]|nr:S24 family peptidase [Pseudobdellovibrionaceae bacterium]